MTIRAVVFDIGGVLEMAADGRDPTLDFQTMVSAWEGRLKVKSGALSDLLEGFREGGMLGMRTEKEWHHELRNGAGMAPSTLDSFLRDFWDLYLGTLNTELASYLRQLRPRYKTALLSNSFVGAREQEQARYELGALTDFIVYSHEVGLAKPDRRIYELTCARLDLLFRLGLYGPSGGAPSRIAVGGTPADDGPAIGERVRRDEDLLETC